MKPTPDQLSRLIDEIAPLADEKYVTPWMVFEAAAKAIGVTEAEHWYYGEGDARNVFGGIDSEPSFAGLSAVLILLSEGG